MSKENKKRYKVYEHTIDENVNSLYCVYCDEKPHTGDGLCWRGEDKDLPQTRLKTN